MKSIYSAIYFSADLASLGPGKSIYSAIFIIDQKSLIQPNLFCADLETLIPNHNVWGAARGRRGQSPQPITISMRIGLGSLTEHFPSQCSSENPRPLESKLERGILSGLMMIIQNGYKATFKQQFSSCKFSHFSVFPRKESSRIFVEMETGNFTTKFDVNFVDFSINQISPSEGFHKQKLFFLQISRFFEGKKWIRI